MRGRFEAKRGQSCETDLTANSSMVDELHFFDVKPMAFSLDKAFRVAISDGILCESKENTDFFRYRMFAAITEDRKVQNVLSRTAAELLERAGRL